MFLEILHYYIYSFFDRIVSNKIFDKYVIRLMWVQYLKKINCFIVFDKWYIREEICEIMSASNNNPQFGGVSWICF